MNENKNNLHTLIPIEDFKALMGIDDREDKLSRFCLVTSTLNIEQYCKRKLLRKRYFEHIDYYGDLFMPLNEYPVGKILAVYVLINRKKALWTGDYLEPEFYRTVPDCGTEKDIPFLIEFSPTVARIGCKAIKIVYWAGYAPNNIPADLASACLELAAWNLNRYRGKRIGMTGNIKGAGKEGEHFEMSMPENVRTLLEPYRRKVI